MAEALLAHHGKGRFISHSAGSHPTGEVHPMSLSTLAARGIATKGYRSKSWDEFANTPIDIVITVCHNAANETCPVFLGNHLKAHWGVPDPAKFEGTDTEIRAEFSRICDVLERRIQKLVQLPVGDAQKELAAIGML